MSRLVILFLSFFAFVSFSCTAQSSDPPTYTVQTVTTEISVPWGMAWLPDGDMLITERDGAIWRYSDGQLLNEPLDGVPEVWARSQGGLLDIAVHPNYSQNGWVYITYSSPKGGGGANTALMRAKLNEDRTKLIDKELLYKAEPNTQRGQHFGSRIEFDGEGYVYFGIGDRGNRDVNPQDITRDAGKIYRLYDDGGIPEDNPFVDMEEAKKAIFAYGIRNPQGMDMHPQTGELWEHEHGPRGGDEVNIIRAGNNYGWPIISYGINYSGTEFAEDTARAGMEQPEWYWDPSIAPSGMTFVTSEKYPDWQGDLLVGSLKFGYIVRCIVENNTITREEILFRDIGRTRNIKQGPDGYIYIATEGDNGIVRLVPKE
ncbi:PQQ-dependent sugar dehydrogenase [Fodinibius halophilus]|uniref:PQQ-dependent sugar dehydrogenase n=1 Tax=Fodinibius halophilus TaxID=1736908 RepID=A0A6M1T0S1_9BACT|nr:PQQ-dependent sugar dehydrogenase [Fodinibius halophilus]NGP87549.1 PQQ-dependent sugar dehydrogenase [Fodinibius halophilus]